MPDMEPEFPWETELVCNTVLYGGVFCRLYDISTLGFSSHIQEGSEKRQDSRLKEQPIHVRRQDSADSEDTMLHVFFFFLTLF